MLITKVTESVAHAFDLDVQFNGLDVTIKAGQIQWEGETLDLIEDEDVAIGPDGQHPMVVMGYLVRDTQDGNRLRVFVDQYIQDGVDEMYAFTRGGRFTLLAYLFLFDLPAGGTDILRDCPTVTVMKMVPVAPQPEPEA